MLVFRKILCTYEMNDPLKLSNGLKVLPVWKNLFKLTYKVFAVSFRSQKFLPLFFAHDIFLPFNVLLAFT